MLAMMVEKDEGEGDGECCAERVVRERRGGEEAKQRCTDAARYRQGSAAAQPPYRKIPRQAPHAPQSFKASGLPPWAAPPVVFLVERLVLHFQQPFSVAGLRLNLQSTLLSAFQKSLLPTLSSTPGLSHTAQLLPPRLSASLPAPNAPSCSTSSVADLLLHRHHCPPVSPLLSSARRPPNLATTSRCPVGACLPSSSLSAID